MPNWCDNQITITGPNSVIDKIEKIVNEEKDGDGLLNFMSPMPKELDGTMAPSSASDKPQPMIEGFDESTISFGFSSAWSPPINAYQTFIMNMSEKNLDVSVKAYYYEGGCDFMGCWDNGDDDCYAPSELKSTDDWWNDGIGADLDEMFNITESMAEYEAEQEAEKEDVTEYVKGKAMNIGEEA